MLLSIIIPCYNCERNILHLLDIIRKNIDSKTTEVILVNDGSKDNTLKVINNYIMGYKLCNFYVYDYSNSGAAVARSNGLAKAKGEYVFFVDSDDRLDESFYKKISSTIYTIKPDMIYFSSKCYSLNSEGVLNSGSYKIKIKETKEYSNPEVFLDEMLTNDIWTCAVWSYVFRRQHAIESMSYFTKRSAHEDFLFTLRMLCNSKKIYTLHDELYKQIENSGSLTRSSKNSDYILQRISAYKESVDDISKYLSVIVINKYNKWSFFSIKALVFNNKHLIPRLLFMPSFFSYCIKNNKFIFEYVRSKLIK